MRTRDNRISSSLAVSEVLTTLPVVAYDYVMVVPEIREDAVRWLSDNRDDLLATQIVKGDER